MEVLTREALETMADQLEASGEYRVMRKLPARAPLPSPPPDGRLGLVIDVETTGMDVRGDEVIELAMVRFAYSPEGEVLGVVDTFQGYHEPTKAISEEITALTGISADTVAGHKLDIDAVGAFVAPAVIVLAHNAAFDRRFAERLHPYFSTKARAAVCANRLGARKGLRGPSSFISRRKAASSMTSTARSLIAWPPWSSWRTPYPILAAQPWPCSWSGRASRAGRSGPKAHPSSTGRRRRPEATAGAAARTAARAPGGAT